MNKVAIRESKASYFHMFHVFFWCWYVPTKGCGKKNNLIVFCTKKLTVSLNLIFNSTKYKQK